MNSRSFIFISLIVSFTMSAVVSGEQAEKSRHEGAKRTARIVGYAAEALFPLVYITVRGADFYQEVSPEKVFMKYPFQGRGFKKQVWHRLRRPSHFEGISRDYPNSYTEGAAYIAANYSFLGMMAACMGHGLYGLQKELNLDLFKRLRELGARLKPKRLKDLKTGVKRLVREW